jgi:hypothetical protein
MKGLGRAFEPNRKSTTVQNTCSLPWNLYFKSGTFQRALQSSVRIVFDVSLPRQWPWIRVCLRCSFEETLACQARRRRRRERSWRQNQPATWLCAPAQGQRELCDSCRNDASRGGAVLARETNHNDTQRKLLLAGSRSKTTTTPTAETFARSD